MIQTTLTGLFLLLRVVLLLRIHQLLLTLVALEILSFTLLALILLSLTTASTLAITSVTFSIFTLESVLGLYALVHLVHFTGSDYPSIDSLL